MDGWLRPGWIVGAALVLLAFEALTVLARGRKSRVTAQTLGWLASLAAGAGLLVALWAALAAGGGVFVLIGLLVALVGHACDVVCRLRIG